VSTIAQYLDFGLWRDTLQSSFDSLGQTAFWTAVLQIVVINILLSGDNAVVIAMACRDLPPRHRRGGMVAGAGIAVILRIAFSAVIVALMQVPYLKLAGGVTLLYIAVRLLLPARADDNRIGTAVHLWHAIWIVAVADIVMSLDNVIAIAAAAQGSLILLGVGLALSIPLILAGATAVLALLDRFPILVWGGAALLGWVAGNVITTDPAVSNRLIAVFGESSLQQTELAAAIAGAVLAVALGALWRSARSSKMRVDAAGGKSGDA